MITFKQFLYEASIQSWTVKQMDSAKAALEGDYSNFFQSLKNGSLLFRGFRQIEGNGVREIDTTDSRRTSRDTHNIYQMMMDASASLSKFPSRSNSIICTTSSATAESYTYDPATKTSGSLLVVVPPNNTKIAQMETSDLLFTRFKYGFDFDDLDTWVFNYFSMFNLAPDIKGDRRDSWTDVARADKLLAEDEAEEVFYKLCAFFNHNILIRGTDLLYDDIQYEAKKFTELSDEHREALKTKGSNTEFGNQILDALRSTKTKRFQAISSVIMTPENLNLHLKTAGDSLPSNCECWFSGKALVLPIDVFKQIIDDVINNDGDVNRVYFKMLKAGE